MRPAINDSPNPVRLFVWDLHHLPHQPVRIETQPYHDVDLSSLTFSPNNRHLALAIWARPKFNGIPSPVRLFMWDLDHPLHQPIRIETQPHSDEWNECRVRFAPAADQLHVYCRRYGTIERTTFLTTRSLATRAREMVNRDLTPHEWADLIGPDIPYNPDTR